MANTLEHGDLRTVVAVEQGFNGRYLTLAKSNDGSPFDKSVCLHKIDYSQSEFAINHDRENMWFKQFYVVEDEVKNGAGSKADIEVMKAVKVRESENKRRKNEQP